MALLLLGGHKDSLPHFFSMPDKAVLATVPNAAANCLTNTLEEGKCVWLWGKSSLWQEREVAGHIVSAVRKQRAVKAAVAQLTLSLFILGL